MMTYKASDIKRIRKADELVIGVSAISNRLPEIRRKEWLDAMQILREISISNQLKVEEELNIEDDT